MSNSIKTTLGNIDAMIHNKRRWKDVLKRFFIFKSLPSQLLSRSLFILASLLILIGIFQYMFMKNFIYENRARSVSGQIASIPENVWETKINSIETQQTNNENLTFFGATVAFIDNTGSRFFVLSEDPKSGGVPKFPKQVYLNALKMRKPHYKIMDNGTEIVLQPIKNGTGGLLGIVEVSKAGDKPDILVRQMTIYLTLSIIALTMGLLTFMPVLRRTLIPLSKMISNVEKINAGNLDTRLPSHQGQIEIDRLAVSFNGMLERLDTSFEAEKKAKEQMRRFIDDASHELRTPLTSIHGFLEVLLEGASNRPEQLHKILKSMYGESERANKLVQDLFLLAKMDRNPTFKMEEGFLDRTIYEMESQLKLLAEKRKVIFNITSNVKARFDKDKIKQVILNLYHNAIHHTDPEKGIIKITLEQNSKVISLAIQDNGPGISEEHISHLFDRFYRVESSRSRKYGGSGLGLAISKTIVDNHGGTIQVESTIGEGSTFRVLLPK